MVTELRRGLAQSTLEAALPAMAARLVEIALTSRSHRASIEAIAAIHGQLGTGKPAPPPSSFVDYEVIDGPCLAEAAGEASAGGTRDACPPEEATAGEGVVKRRAGRSLTTESDQGPIGSSEQHEEEGLQPEGPSASVIPFQRRRSPADDPTRGVEFRLDTPLIPQPRQGLEGLAASVTRSTRRPCPPAQTFAAIPDKFLPTARAFPARQ